jgi:hypothetical protein
LPLPERSVRIGGLTMATALLGLGFVSCFVQFSETAKLSGLPGQSPLPERSAPNWQPHHGDCALGLGSINCFMKSSQTARLFGQVGQSPLPERSAPNWQPHHGDCAFGVRVDQLLREIFSDCKTLWPSWTVAVTGKICTKLAASRWRLRFVVGVD